MDVSDGLAGDLAKLCAASGVTARVDASLVPLSAGARSLIAEGRVGIESLLAGGDDYEILCAIPESSLPSFIEAARAAGIAATVIGIIERGTSPPSFVDGSGSELVMGRLSYSHF